jgi:hypothetical protein
MKYKGAEMDPKTTTTPDSDLLWLTDNDGNNYLMRRDIIEHRRVPKEIADEIRSYVEADTHGYGNSEYLLKGISNLWGLSSKDKGYDMNFDLDQDGQIGKGDWEIAMKGYYEEHPGVS